MSDEEIVALIQNGDKEKYRIIMDRYYKKLLVYIKRMINQTDEDSEDILSEVLINAYENILGFDTKKKFSSWIYRIAHNKAIDSFKKRKLRTTTIEDKDEYLDDRQKLIEDLEIERETSKKIARAVKQLDLKYREVIVLHYFEDRNYEEISDILRIPTNNVGVLLYRAKKMLKKMLEELK